MDAEYEHVDVHATCLDARGDAYVSFAVCYSIRDVSTLSRSRC